MTNFPWYLWAGLAFVVPLALGYMSIRAYIDLIAELLLISWFDDL